MKKQILSISLAVIVIVALAVAGILIFNRPVEVETGKGLDVSWYDAEAEEYTITTKEQLYEFAEISQFYDFEDQTVKLGADIVVNTGNASDWLEDAPKEEWSPITGFAGTFDGKGHTISGIYAKAYNTPIALFINTESSCEIKNLNLVNSCYDTTGFDGATGGIAANGGGKFRRIYCDAIINNNGFYAAGILSRATKQSTIEECWYDGVITMTGRNAGGIVDAVLAQRTTVNHCLFTGEIHTTWYHNGTRIGGLCGMTFNTGTSVAIRDSLAVGEITTENLNLTGGAMGVVSANTTFIVEDTYVSTASVATGFGLGRSGATGTQEGTIGEVTQKNLVGTGGFEWTTLDFENYWAITEDSTPILQCFADEVPSVAGLEKAFDTSWYDADEKVYVISNVKQLYGFSMLSNSMNFSGKTIQLGADIVVNEGNASTWAKNEPRNVWNPITKFAGTFDGQGHTISGLYLSTSNEVTGFIKETTVTATVKNLSIKNSYFCNNSTTNTIMGSVVGRAKGTFDTLYSDAIIVSTGAVNGGIIGQVNGLENNLVTNCWFNGSVSAREMTGRYVGGIAGNVVQGTTVVEHCLNTGRISSEITGTPAFTAGLIGSVMNKDTILSINDCLNVGDVVTEHHVCVGAIIGRIPAGPTVDIRNTYASFESYQHPTSGFMGIGNQSAGKHTGAVTGSSLENLKGINGYKYTTLDFNKYWGAMKDATPILLSFGRSTLNVANVWRVDTSWYSDSKSEFTISNLSQFYGFAALVNGGTNFEGKIVKLGADITVNSGSAKDWAAGTAVPENLWTTIGNSSAPFKGTFDGQGHTVSGIYVNNGAAQYTGLFGFTVNSTIKNLSLTNSCFISTAETADMGSIVGYGDGVFENIYSDAILNATGIRIGGIIGVSQDKTTGGASAAADYSYSAIRNCWFNGTINVTFTEAKAAYAGGFVGYALHGNATLAHVLYTGTINYKNTGEAATANGYSGGFLGRANKGVIVAIADSLSAGYMNIENATLNNVRSIISVEIDSLNATDTVYATADFAKTTGVSSVAPIQRSTILGIDGYRRTNLDFDNYWAAIEGEVPELKRFTDDAKELSTAGVEKEITPDTNWDGDGTSSNPYIIADAADLFGLATAVNAGNNYAGQYFKLTNDIILNSTWDAGSGAVPATIWTPIGVDKSHTFRGIFEGSFKTISGLYVDSDEFAVGLFGVTRDSIIRNLYITNSSFTGHAGQVGSVIGYGDGKLDQIYSDAYLYTDSQKIGGLIGTVQDTSAAATSMEITNCHYAGVITQTYNGDLYAGGLIGAATFGPITIANSIYSGNISATYTGTAANFAALAGGVIGGITNRNYEITVKNSVVLGSIDVKAESGGTKISGIGLIIGRYRGGTSLTLESVYTSNTYSCDVAGALVDDAAAPEATTIEVNFENASSVYAIVTLLNSAVAQNNENLMNTPWIQWEYKDGILMLVFAETLQPEDAIDTSWYNDAAAGVGQSAANPYLISDLADLYGLAELVNTGKENFSGKFIRLEQDIVVNENWTAGPKAPNGCKPWNPIGKDKTYMFRGTFDGNGKSISGIYLKTDKEFVGVFGITLNSTIKNLKVENSYFDVTGPGTAGIEGVGSIVGYGCGTFDTIYSDVIITSSRAQVAGIVGRIQGGSAATKIRNCHYAGEITLTGTATYAGGIVGALVTQSLEISNCLNTANISCEQKSGNLFIGGILASVNNNNLTATIKNCVNTGTITAEVTNHLVGAIYGGTTKTVTFKLENVYYSADSCTAATGTTPTSGSATKITDLDAVINALNSAVTANNAASADKWALWKSENDKAILDLWKAE